MRSNGEDGSFIHFDDDESFTGPNSASQTDILHSVSLLLITMHEVGHVSGLEHNHLDYSIMFPLYKDADKQDKPKGEEFELCWADRQLIQVLYGNLLFK